MQERQERLLTLFDDWITPPGGRRSLSDTRG